MYYGSYTVGTSVGKRYEGIEHLKKLAKIIADNYDLKTEVLGNVTGKVYENHLVTTFESMAQMEDFNKKFSADPNFLEWFKNSVDLFDWKNARQNLFVVE